MIPSCGTISGAAALWACAGTAMQVVVITFGILFLYVFGFYAILILLDLHRP